MSISASHIANVTLIAVAMSGVIIVGAETGNSDALLLGILAIIAAPLTFRLDDIDEEHEVIERMQNLIRALSDDIYY